MSTETTVSNPTHLARYDDMSYPGNRFDIQDQPTYYQVSYSGVEKQHEKYLRLKRAVMEGIEHVLDNNTGSIHDEALSSLVRDLKHWTTQPGGFTCQHMPWRILLPHNMYRTFIYVLRAQDTERGNAAYTSIRRYGKWV